MRVRMENEDRPLVNGVRRVSPKTAVAIFAGNVLRKAGPCSLYNSPSGDSVTTDTVSDVLSCSRSKPRLQAASRCRCRYSGRSRRQPAEADAAGSKQPAEADAGAEADPAGSQQKPPAAPK